MAVDDQFLKVRRSVPKVLIRVPDLAPPRGCDVEEAVDPVAGNNSVKEPSNLFVGGGNVIFLDPGHGS